MIVRAAPLPPSENPKMTTIPSRAPKHRLGESLRAALVAISVLALAAPHSAFAADPGYLSDGAYVEQGKTIDLGIGKTYIVSLPRDAKEVFVADPAIANAVVRSARKAYLIGAAPGQTDVKFLDGEGREIASYAVSVSRDVGSIKSAIERSISGGNVRVEGAGDGVVVTGTVKSAQEAQTAMDVAAGYMADPKKVVNALKIEGQDQVMLKVKVVEMRREVIKQLGVDYASNGLEILGLGTSGVTNFSYPITNDRPDNVITGLNNKLTGSASVRAMERSGVSRTLAEPTLTAISGETAKFLVGGEFPVVAGYDRTEDKLQIEFKQFGVGLNFTPVVLSGGRISLKVATEVSELDPSVSVQLAGGVVVPGLRVRRADSTVELPSGGSIAMAGLMRQETGRAVEGLPGLLKLPVIGALFRSNDYRRNETELAIFVTPYLAKATSPDKLSAPDDGFAEPSDPSAMLLGRLNRIYGIPGKIDPASVGRRGGFIID